MELARKTTTTILGPDGAPIERPAVFLTNEEATLLRRYQRFGEREGLQGTLTCNLCKQPMEAYVQGDIGFFCECRSLVWKAS